MRTIRKNCLLAIFALFGALGWATTPAQATTNSAFLTGTVVADGTPVPGALVTAAGNNAIVRTTTDAAGRFRFGALAFGTYAVSAGARGLQGVVYVDLGSGGATITIVLSALREIGHSTVRATPVHGSGSDTVLDSTVLTRSPYSDSFPEALIELPGAVRGANGVVHMNGDHGVIDYLIDGVPLPQALNREIGSEIDSRDISFVDVIEGAYPAQYGLRFGSVLNVTTRAGTGPAGFDGSTEFGSYTNLDESLGYHAPLPGGGGYSVALGAQQSTRGLDPPDFNSPHNDWSDTDQFVRFTLPEGNGNFTDVTLIHSYRTYQVPNDVQFGEPADTDDNETQDDTFLNLQFRHPIGETGEFTIGPAFKISHVRDFGDPGNDFTYGETLNLVPPPYGNGGTPTDCATAVTTGIFLPTTCGFSLHDDKTSLDGILQSDYVQQFGNHVLRAGVSWDVTRVIKTYDVTLQPDNFLAPILTPLMPDAPITVVDDNPNIGNTYQSYIQDSWRISDQYEADYGLRYDYFTIRSTDFAQGFGAFSPRLKFTRFFGPRASVYVYIGRFFEPFSFENVDPRAAQLLNLPLQPTIAQFDLKPERDTQLELGGHIPVGLGSFGFRVWQKNANDLIDDTQVGVYLLASGHQLHTGADSQEAINYTIPFARDGRAYINIAHTVSLNKGCETQLLAPCFGSPNNFTPADHDQTYSVTGGVLFNDSRGGWFSADGDGRAA